MTTDNTKPGFVKRLWRALIGFLALLTFIAILAAVAFGGYFGFIEIQRIASRLNESSRTVSSLQSDIDALKESSTTQEQVAELEATISDLEAQLDLLQGDLTDDVAAQQAALDALEAEIEGSDAEVGTLSSSVTTLNEALNAIQTDLVANSSEIDALGGEIDSVRTAVSDLGEEMIAMEEAAFARIDAINVKDPLQETLALFRAWELITRARLRLLENNIGLATEDIDEALQTIDAVIALEAGEIDKEKLERVQTRLALAFLSLPDSPDSAAADLESAWDELDAIFTADLLTGITITEENTAETEGEVAPGEESNESETAGTATPVPTPTATPEP